MAQMTATKAVAKTIQVGDIAHGNLGPAAIGVGAQETAEIRRVIHDDASYANASALAPGCVDGRRDRFGACIAGGAATLVTGYIAAHGLKPGETIVNVLHHLAGLGYTIIVHKQCRALDVFVSVARDMTAGAPGTFELMARLGLTVAPVQQKALAAVGAAVPDNFVPREEVLFKAVEDLGGQVERFRIPEHREVATVVNTRFGTSFHREALRGFANAPQAFVVDQWVLADTANRLANAPQARQLALHAMTFFNCGVLLRLAGKDHFIEIHT